MIVMKYVSIMNMNCCKHPILGYHLSGERWRALAKKLCHKINDFYW